MKAYRECVPFVDEDVVMTDYIAATMRFMDSFRVEIDKEN